MMKVGRYEIELHDDLTMPAKQFALWMKYVIIDASLGSDPKNLMANLNRARLYNGENETEKTEVELGNIMEQVHLILNEMNPTLLCFAAKIKSVNGKEIKKMTDADVLKWHKKLSGVQVGKLREVVDSVKKKFMRNFNCISRKDSKTKAESIITM